MSFLGGVAHFRRRLCRNNAFCHWWKTSWELSWHGYGSIPIINTIFSGLFTSILTQRAILGFRNGVHQGFDPLPHSTTKIIEKRGCLAQSIAQKWWLTSGKIDGFWIYPIFRQFWIYLENHGFYVREIIPFYGRKIFTQIYAISIVWHCGCDILGDLLQCLVMLESQPSYPRQWWYGGQVIWLLQCGAP